MAKIKENNYFQMFIDMTDTAIKSARYLYDVLASFNEHKLESAQMEGLHAIEREGDAKLHDLTEQLVKEFLPPIDREDVLVIAREIDNVTDSVDEILRRIYMFRVEKMTPEAMAFSELLIRMCESLNDLIRDFAHFKKASESVREKVRQINTLEEEGDLIHLRAIRDLWGSDAPSREVLSWREVYEAFENCCDAIEHVADAVEEVVMKNS